MVDRHIVIEVTFNRGVDRSTVIVGKTLVLKTQQDPHAHVSLTWSENATSLSLRTTKVVEDLLKFDPDGHFTLTLIGTDTGEGAVTDRNGHPLDGESDGVDGGDYQTSFTLVG